jgi:acyl-CoA synthetase (AMP-forming)/AMP-acid ligase II
VLPLVEDVVNQQVAGRATACTLVGATPDGFVSLADMGTLDVDGYLYRADRRVDLIISGGANVYPAEVEAARAR